MSLLSGKRALVTGSSRGIGSAIAVELAKAGADIAIHYVGNRESAECVAEKCRGYGADVGVFQADLCCPEDTERLMEQVGNVDILVLNASVQIAEEWNEISVENYEKQMNCNYLSSLIAIQKAIPYMKEQKWGRVISIGSVQESAPHPKMLVYSSTKAAQTMMIKSLALQLSHFGITFNNVAPGAMKTDRNIDALADKEYVKKVEESIPVGYIGEKEESSYIVRLLASDEGKYITGQSIYVDGGKGV